VRKHLASLRSICETLGGKPAYCVCGKQVEDGAVHFTTRQYNRLAKLKRLVEWRGMTVDSKDGFEVNSGAIHS